MNLDGGLLSAFSLEWLHGERIASQNQLRSYVF